jgi:hypothetical protein
LVERWNEALTTELLSFVWEAYDELKKSFAGFIDWDQDFDDLERSISEELERNIHGVLRHDPFLPYTVQHGAYERETRMPAPAQPPEYDIACQWLADPRIMWPLEAKVLKGSNTTDVADYVRTLKERFLTGRYAPFSGGGAMLGYLKGCKAEQIFERIEQDLSTLLKTDAAFKEREHRTSSHDRQVTEGKDYPVRFHCHHLMLDLSA